MTAAEDIRLDVPAARRLVGSAGLGFRAVEVVRLPGSSNSAVFEVRSAAGESAVVKVYTDRWDWKLRKEAFVYGALAHHGADVPVPRIVLADDSRTLLPHSFAVMTKLEGQSVFSLLEQLDEPQLAEIYGQVGSLLRTLHAVEFEAFGYVGTDGVVEPHATNVEYMRTQFDRKLREFDDLGGDPRLRRRVELHVAERAELLAGCPRPSYCHNDCHEGNMLVVPVRGGWRISGLLDFENVLAGDPLLDLAKTHYYARRGTETTLAALAEAHGDLRGDWREALDLYVLYHALELWDWFASVGVTDSLASIAHDMGRMTAAVRAR